MASKKTNKVIWKTKIYKTFIKPHQEYDDVNSDQANNVSFHQKIIKFPEQFFSFHDKSNETQKK